MENSTQGDRGTRLKPAEKAVFGILAPLVFFVPGFLLILGTATGEGPSVGGRGMVLALVLFPAGFVAVALLNTWVLFPALRSRLGAFTLGTFVPAVGLVLAYAYLWRLGPFRH